MYNVYLERDIMTTSLLREVLTERKQEQEKIEFLGHICEKYDVYDIDELFEEYEKTLKETGNSGIARVAVYALLEDKMPRRRNPVAKNLRKFNKATIQRDRKKALKRGDVKHKSQIEEAELDEDGHRLLNPVVIANKILSNDIPLKRAITIANAYARKGLDSKALAWKKAVNIVRNMDNRMGNVEEDLGQDRVTHHRRATQIAGKLRAKGYDKNDAIQRAHQYEKNGDKKEAMVWYTAADIMGTTARRHSELMGEEGDENQQLYAIWDRKNNYWVNKPSPNLKRLKNSAERRNMEYGRMVYFVCEFDPKKPGVPGKTVSYR